MKNFRHLALTLLVAWVSVLSGNAYDFTAENADGVTIAYSIISSSDLTCQVVSSSSHYSGNVVIPASVLYNGKKYSVTTIGEFAFHYCSSLTSVEIPNSVTSIRRCAFEECSSLTSVEIPNSVTSIGYRAFRYCSSLFSVEIPNSVTSIEYSAFAGCSSLTSVEIPNSVTSIEFSAFEGCSSLFSVEIPNSVTSIEYSAFAFCRSMTSVEISNSVTTIGKDAFYGCNHLRVVINESSLNIQKGSEDYGYVGYYAKVITNVAHEDGFYYSDNTNATLVAYVGKNNIVEIPNSVTTIGEEAFAYCRSMTSVEIPNSVTTIGEEAFAYCRSMTSVEIPNSVTTIGEEAFAYCRSMTSVEIPNSVTSIEYKAFEGCVALKTITLGSGVQKIGKSAFYGCTSLTKLYAKPTVPPLCDHFTLGSIDKEACTLYVYPSAIASYQAADPWKEFFHIEGTDNPDDIGVVNDSCYLKLHKSGNVISLSGTQQGMTVAVYSLDGKCLGSTVAEDGETRLAFPVADGSMVIVKYGDKAMKYRL